MRKVRLIVRLEQLLNKTPNIGILMMGLIIISLIVGHVVSLVSEPHIFFAVNSVTLEKTQQVFSVQSMLNFEGIVGLLNSSVENFISIKAVPLVIVTLIGFGIAERSGFLYTFFKVILFKIPGELVTLILVLVGIISNFTATGEFSAGYILLLPLSAFIFIGNDRNPLAGIAAMFASIFAGYSINILFSSSRLTMNAMTSSVAREIIPNYIINGVTNNPLYLMLALVIVAALTITFITERYILKILPIYDLHLYEYHRMTKFEKRGLIASVVATFVFVIFYVFMLIPVHKMGGFLASLPGAGLLIGVYNPETTTYAEQFVTSPFASTFIAHLSLYLIVCGTLFGIFSKKFGSLSQVVRASTVTLADHAEYFVLMFIGAQLMYVLYNSGLALFVMLKLTSLLDSTGGNTVVTVLKVVLVTSLINLFIPSTISKWEVMAPIVIPLFIINSLNPVLAQSAYQVGDSLTNVVTVMMPYTLFVYVLFKSYAVKTKQHCGNGTVLKLTLPYSITLAFTLAVTIALWISLGLLLGPDVNIYI